MDSICRFLLDLGNDEAEDEEDLQNVETIRSILTDSLLDVPEGTMVAICSQ